MGFAIGEKKKKVILRVLLFLIFVMTAITGYLAATFMAAGAVISKQEPHIMAVLEIYNEATDRDVTEGISVSPGHMQEMRELLTYTPAGQLGIAWVIEHSLLLIEADPVKVEENIRYALNKLQGYELWLYMRTLDRTIKGFESLGFNDVLDKKEELELGEDHVQSIKERRDIVTLSGAELEALKACKQAQKERIEAPWGWGSNGNLFIVVSMLAPELVFDDRCALSGKIALSGE